MSGPNLHNIMVTCGKREVIRTVFEEWYRRDPRAARENIKYIHEVTAQDLKSHGGYADDTGFLQYRFPTDLFFMLRAVIPGWGDDDADMKDLIQELPDLMPKAMKGRLRTRKKVDHRPRKLIWRKPLKTEQ